MPQSFSSYISDCLPNTQWSPHDHSWMTIPLLFIVDILGYNYKKKGKKSKQKNERYLWSIRCRPQTTAARYYSMSEEFLFQCPLNICCRLWWPIIPHTDNSSSIIPFSSTMLVFCCSVTTCTPTVTTGAPCWLYETNILLLPTPSSFTNVFFLTLPLSHGP